MVCLTETRSSGRLQLAAVCVSGALQGVVELIFLSADEAAPKEDVG